jgi:hypothetical protein
LSNLPPRSDPPLTLDDIDFGVAVVEEVQGPDRNDLLERAAAEKAQLANKLARARIKNVKADRAMRKAYAGRILIYLYIYSAIIGLMVVATGFKLWSFVLPVEVLATLVGSTAVAAIGLVGFVARGLFKAPPSNIE